MIWDLVTRLGGQIRIGGMGRLLGWDFQAALMLGEAMGISRFLIAEFLPEIEQSMVLAIRSEADHHE